MKIQTGDTIQVYGSADGGRAIGSTGREIVKSFTMRITSVAQGTIEGIELRKDGEPRVVRSATVYRSIVVSDDHISDVYEVTGRPVDEVTMMDSPIDDAPGTGYSSLTGDVEVPESAVTQAVNTPDILSGDPRRTDTPVQLDGDRFYRPAPWVSKNGKRKNTRAARRRINAKSR